MKTLRPWIVAGLVLALIAGCALWYQRANAPKPPKITTATVERGRVVARVTATGTLSALVTVQVGAQVSGRISLLKADFNSPVKKDEVIAKLDPQLFIAAVEQAKANMLAADGALVKAKAQAVDAERQFQRNKQLREQKLIAQADLDTSEANAEAARAQVIANQGAVEQAKASLHQAEINLNYTTIISPINGVVISRNVDVGQTVAAALQAPTLFTIAEDLKKMQVDTNVAESDVGKLKPTMEATFTVDAYPSSRFKGTVRQIRNAPQTVQNVVTYDAVIDVDNTDLRLKPGMTANVTFVYAERDDVIKVPNAALRFRPPPELLHVDAGAATPPPKKHSHDAQATPDQRTLWLLRNNQPVMVSVRTGVTDGTTSEILEGDLKPGDQVITEVTGGSAPAAAAAPSPFRRGF
ncbi:MAG TPA: efflux RND transporter periplasmic adaptor subunit [Polyangia bacterium]|nr:efflux RND transporter periplasmic adaptor subunit [Polyangia bacterium]